MQRYNPDIHHRRSIRLKGYDYSQAGAYFITICCHEMKYKFGQVANGEMVLNDAGVIAHDQWLQLATRFPNIQTGVFQIMPNHMHGIIIINAPIVRATLAVAPTVWATLAVAPPGASAMANHSDMRAGASPAPTGSAEKINDDVVTHATIGDIVGAYKSLVAHTCLNLFKTKKEKMGKLWQRDYYEHIIRNEKSFHTISSYIINNPEKWMKDKFLG